VTAARDRHLHIERFRSVCHTSPVLAATTYRSNLFAQACQQLGFKHRFTRPYRPQTNGRAERFIQTITREWAY